ncbi:DUF6318 family protein [Dermabacter vaginalis]|uniref:DUF6318 domain-containing protein n=1 Tax=Dermabacter vaginalis TaxID=1630135 RepID=A0ABX6A6Z9_9MICO|nr:DUF6318 family protein [Dermabacter vaginalis]QEU12341.1 hypothetical protein FOB48_08515 [Dermabacter vaginalis]
MRSGQLQLFGVMTVVALLAALAGCGGEREVGGPTPAVPSAAAPSSSDGGGGDAGAASDSGGAESPDRTKGLPPENEALEAPDKADYLGINYPTEQGAMAAAQYFIDAMYYGYATGDSAPLKEISELQTCERCAQVITEIDEWQAGPRYLSPTTITVDSVERLPDRAQYEGASPVVLQFTRGQTVEVSQGKEGKQFPPTSYEAVFLLEWEEEKWAVAKASWEKREA